MSDIEPHELSAYLDGELTADRAQAVAAALASDPALRAEYEALAGADATWRQTAQAATFQPYIRWPQKSICSIPAPAAAALATILVVVKLAPHLTEGLALGLAVHALALAVALIGIAWVALPARDVTAQPR
jgi:anti-sigma factor RsiW